MVEPVDHLKNAPIKEALIDFQVKLPDNTNVESLDSCYSEFSESYPKKESINESVLGFSVKAGEPAEIGSRHRPLGFKYTSSDGKYVAQFRLNGFTVSRLEPYSTWEEMKKEAQRLWALYIRAVKPISIIRVATRFINVMPLRLREISELDKWLVSAPVVPNGLPQRIPSFLSRVVLNNPDIDANGIVTLAFENADDERPPVTLDIDVFVSKEYDTVETEFWDCLEQLRKFKNEIFFRSITELTVREFQ